MKDEGGYTCRNFMWSVSEVFASCGCVQFEEPINVDFYIQFAFAMYFMCKNKKICGILDTKRFIVYIIIQQNYCPL